MAFLNERRSAAEEPGDKDPRWPALLKKMKLPVD